MSERSSALPNKPSQATFTEASSADGDKRKRRTFANDEERKARKRDVARASYLRKREETLKRNRERKAAARRARGIKPRNLLKDLTPDESRTRRREIVRLSRERNKDRYNAANREKRAAERRARGAKPRPPKREGPRYANGKLKVSAAENRERKKRCNHSPEALAKRAAYKRKWTIDWRKKHAEEYAAYHRRWRAARRAAGNPVPSGTTRGKGMGKIFERNPRALFEAVSKLLPPNLPRSMHDEVLGEATIFYLEGMSVKAAATAALRKVRRDERMVNFESIPIEKAVWL